MCAAEYNIYIIGESNVDKASILNKYLNASDNVEADYTESCKYVTLNKNELCFYI
jgi:tRNA U34 5-carboxymethylaminomethyl modifying GTPase MnmE/TrmE